MTRALSSRIVTCLFVALASSCSDGPSGMRGEIGISLRPPASPNRPQAAPALSTSPSAGRPSGTADLLARRELNLNAKPVGLAAHDFDGDGFDDLAVVTQQPGQLRVFFGTPDGLNATHQARLDIGDFAIAPVVLINPLRIAVASAATRELILVRIDKKAQGEKLFTEQSTTLNGVPRALASSKGSLFVTDRSGALVQYEAGSDSLTKVDTIHTNARAVAILPLSDSGVAVLSQDDESVHLFDRGEDGKLRAKGKLPFDGIPRAAREADLDGDGDLEQIVIGGDRRVLVFGLGEPRPTSWADTPGTPVAFEQSCLVPMALEVADLDGDGLYELVSLGQNDQGYSVIGAFAQAGPLVSISEYAGQDPWDLALGDFDGDGKTDLAAACRSAQSLSLLAGTGIVKPGKPAFHQARRIGVGANPLSIASLDLTGDGKPEVATLDAADGNLSLLLNDGFGALQLADRFPVGPSPRGLRAARLQGKEHPTELLFAVLPAGASASLVALGRRADGTFGTIEVNGPHGARIPSATESGFSVGDLDGDGFDDLAILDQSTRTLTLLRVLPRAQGDQIRLQPLGSPKQWPEGERPSSIAIIDRLDPTSGARRALIAVGLTSGIAILDPRTGRQLALVSPAADLPRHTAGESPARLCSADLDGNGSDDIVALTLGEQGTSPGTLHAYLLDTGLQPIATATATTGLAPAGFAAADLDGDGREDLVLAAQNSHAANLWMTRVKEGRLQLARQNDIGVGLGPLAIAFADLLGKGSLDLLVSNAFSADISAVLNRGSLR